eukprot:2438981-Pleurochrysis_carterae.AAC.2
MLGDIVQRKGSMSSCATSAYLCSKLSRRGQYNGKNPVRVCCECREDWQRKGRSLSGAGWAVCTSAGSAWACAAPSAWRHVPATEAGPATPSCHDARFVKDDVRRNETASSVEHSTFCL